MGDFYPLYRREDYQRIRQIMDDGDLLPATFEGWEKKAQSTIARAASLGVVLKPVVFDPEKFVAFCELHNIPKTSEARARYCIERGLAQDKH